MKSLLKNISVLFILCFGFQTYSQARYCRHIINPNLQISNTSTFDSPPNVTNSSSSLNDPDSSAYPDTFPQRKYVYKLHFNIFRNNDGVRQYDNVGEAEVMNIVRDLNLNYNRFNIFFKYKGFDYVDNTSLTGDVLVDNLFSTFGWMLNNHEFHINILDGKIVTNDENNNLVSIPGFGYQLSTLVFLSWNAVTSTRIASHEIGHCFYLYHDFTNFGSETNSENVIRISDQPNNGYNALYTGDRIHDTPATRIWAESQYDLQGVYQGTDIDYNNLLPATDLNRFFKTQFPRKNNIMHVHDGPDYSIGYFLTIGQGKRIRWAIATDLNNNYGIYNLAETDWEELYQPFETKYIGGDVIVSVTENPNDTGTAIVCRNLLHIDRFQKGFNMKFENIDGTQFAGSTPDELMEIDQTSDYKTRVIQYHPDILQTVQVICTRGVVCQEEAYIGGIVFSTQILGSMNITVKELNEIEAKDPNLFNQLLEQYYHILKKTTSSGAVMEKVFFKQ